MMSTNSPMTFRSETRDKNILIRLPMLKTVSKYILSTVIFLLPAFACPAVPTAPSPQRLVNDFAGIFSPEQTAVLENTLVAFDDSTSNQITVVTVTDLEGYSASEYATRIGLEWKVGSEKFDNGLVLLIKPKTEDSGGQVAISVGYGLEGAIPDAYAKRIIDNELIPHFRQNDYFGGTVAACDVLMKLASGEISEPRSRDDDDAGGVLAFFLFLIFVIIIAAVAAGSNKGNNNGRRGGRGRYDDGDIASAIIIGNLLGGSRGGHSSWGGSGSFGGGFGGFGGGSFGGGGASGSW